MTEKTKAERYLDYLDRILAGDIEPRVIEDKEVEELLQTAKKLIGVDFSKKSKIREQLRRQLILIIRARDKQIQLDSSEDLLKDDDELMEDELSLAAAGSPEFGWRGSCGFNSECPYEHCSPNCIFRNKN